MVAPASDADVSPDGLTSAAEHRLGDRTVADSYPVRSEPNPSPVHRAMTQATARLAQHGSQLPAIKGFKPIIAGHLLGRIRQVSWFISSTGETANPGGVSRSRGRQNRPSACWIGAPSQRLTYSTQS